MEIRPNIFTLKIATIGDRFMFYTAMDEITKNIISSTSIHMSIILEQAYDQRDHGYQNRFLF